MNIREKGRVQFHGIRENKDISAIAMLGDRVLIVADEATRAGNLVQVFEPSGEGFRAVTKAAVALDDPEGPIEEMDLEGLAVDGRTVHVLGSHSARRPRVDPKKATVKNRAALLGAALPQPARDVLLRFECDSTGKAGQIARSSLRSFLDQTAPFKFFSSIAGKENGIDAEGLAVFNGHLFVGFRGPVLTGGFTPVVRCGFGTPIRNPRVLFVGLGGRGIRDLCAVSEGILVLAGPVGNAPGSYDLFFWDGRDCVPCRTSSRSKSRPPIRWIGELPVPKVKGHYGAAQPEGMAVMRETRRHWSVLVVLDGRADGRATRYRVEKPT